MLPEFAVFYLESKVVRNEIKKLAQGSTRCNTVENRTFKIRNFIAINKRAKRNFSTSFFPQTKKSKQRNQF